MLFLYLSICPFLFQANKMHKNQSDSIESAALSSAYKTII